MCEAIRGKYEQYGVDDYYRQFAKEYENPHKGIIESLLTGKKQDLRKLKVLDLCCGTGEVTQCLGLEDIKGLDPYTYEVYRERTKKECYPYTFKDIANGKLTEHFDLVICSFALHLCEESLLHGVLWQLGQIADTLIIITPHKRPDCNKSGWVLVEEVIKDRVRMRTYTKAA